LDDAPKLESIEPEAVNVNVIMNNVYQVLMDAINAANDCQISGGAPSAEADGSAGGDK
jgi:hypothetical protein